MPDSPPDISVPKPWGLARRFLFRFALLYFVLYALPFPFRNLWTTFNGALAEMQEVLKKDWDVDVGAWAWRSDVTEFFYGDLEVKRAGGHSEGWYDSWWEAATTWASQLRWVNLEVIHQGTGSGDTAHDVLKLAISTVIALLLAVLWTLVDRRRTRHPALVPWLHLSVRWYLAFALLGYGLIKLYAGQFSYPSLYRLMNPIGETSPMGLVWTFMGFSKPYEVFSGLGEIVGGLLLLSRRTSLLGCFVAIAVMANVCVLNWMYDVPVKLYSTHLLLFAVALTLPDIKRLWRLFISNKPVPPANLKLTRFAWVNWPLIAFGTLWIGFHLFISHQQNMAEMERRAHDKPALYGVWEVEKMMRNGEDVPTTDETRWKFLALDVGERGWVRTVGGQVQGLCHSAERGQEGTLKIAPSRGNSKPEEVLKDAPTWTYERGEKTVKATKPEPRTRAEYGAMVDQVRPTLVLRGPWEGVDLEVHLVRKVFELERGFHLVQEIPVNR